MTTVALSETAVADAVQALVPTTTPVHVECELRRGRGHASWVLGSRIGLLVGKVALSQRATSPLRLDEQRRLWGMGAPVPRIVGHTPCCEMLGGAALVVSEYLPGRDAERALADLRDEQTRVVVRDLGRAVAQLHRLRVPGFGTDVTGVGNPAPNWASAVRSHVGRLRLALDGETAVMPNTRALAETGLSLLIEAARAISPVVVASPVHADLYLPNVLLDSHDSLSALLDLEHLRWADPVMDFVKPALWIFEGRPEWSGQFLAGYAQVAGVPVEWERRIYVATGWELLSGVVYWSQVGDEAMAADYLGRLTQWVGSGGRWHAWSSLPGSW